MELNVLLWILGGGFTGTWGLCIFFMNRTDNSISQIRTEVQEMKKEIKSEISEIRVEILEIRKEVSELYHCVKDHHGRLCVLEDRGSRP